ncbi:M23 family metallopeptidase [Streptomyces sp. SID13031]|uniref:murein hydrolase activator EnvC family protein n=1 Tax=Streptomyces sp. SID13031 TaxID=2706046 RepID=UPI0013CB5BC4|nr:M23 family metallopeptidase [Streptomyces sp. SID13031]NEA35165.1 M23 family metallopeptidase [Streptomyces sp. SID13031]
MTPFLLTPLALTALLTPIHPAPTPPQSASFTAQPGAVWPLTPRPEVIRGFEPPPKPWLSGHRGLDLRGSPGQQVRSATPGTVTYAGSLAGRGVIVITNGRLRTTYEPVVPTVRVGAVVTPGTPLGHLSAAGSHCTPATCLHWGLLQANIYLNPLALLPHRPIRLLPLAPTPSFRNSAVLGVTTQSLAPHPSITAQPPVPPARVEAQASARDEVASGVIVGLAAAATLIGGLLIRRH